jgi:hypothetical protein
MTREEVEKVKRELKKTQDAIAHADRKTTVNRDLSPVEVPKAEVNERPASGDIPDVVHLPKKQKRSENKW